MALLNLYMILHGNLRFSAIPRSQYSRVLDTCYWPMISIIESGCRIAVEFPAETLEEIHSIDPSFVEKIKTLRDEGKCEIIGSCYSQVIMPLAPYYINLKNLELGMEVYEKMLGDRPRIFFIPEQTFSMNLPDTIRQAGYKTAVMDWDNASEYHHYRSEMRYRPVKVRGSADAQPLDIIWNSSMNSFKFQRYIYGRLSLADYVEGIMEHVKPGKTRALCIYGTDWEIFNYRPMTHEISGNEIDRVKNFFDAVSGKKGVEFVLPSGIPAIIPPCDSIEISSAEMPLPCKNRDDYNVVRWAVSGRDNVQQNTCCNEMTRIYRELEAMNPSALSRDMLRQLISLWGSDFRTKTTNEKYYDFWNRAGAFSASISEKILNLKPGHDAGSDLLIRNNSQYDYTDACAETELNFSQGRFMDVPGLAVEGQEVPTQCENIERYQDGSIRKLLMVFKISLKSMEQKNGTLISRASSLKIPYSVRLNGNEINIKTPVSEVTFNTSTGGDVRSLVFPAVSEIPLVKYLHPVYFDNIAFSNDYYSGWTQLCDSEMRVFNDTIQAKFTPDNGIYNIRIPVHFKIPFSSGYLHKRYDVYLSENRVDLTCHFFFPNLSPFYLRTAITTINPEAFSLETLGYSAANGSAGAETFALKGRSVNHTRAPRQMCSSSGCLGATEGWVAAHDSLKGLALVSSRARMYSVPMMEFREIKDNWLFRIYHSIGETDDTGKIVMTGHSTIRVSYQGFRGSAESIRPGAHLINNPFHVVQK